MSLVEQSVRLNRELDNTERAMFQQMMSLLGDATRDRVNDRPDYEAKERKSDLPWLRAAIRTEVGGRDNRNNVHVQTVRDV